MVAYIAGDELGPILAEAFCVHAYLLEKYLVPPGWCRGWVAQHCGEPLRDDPPTVQIVADAIPPGSATSTEAVL